MGTVQRAIDVRVPIRTAYEQWARFEDYPFFMEGVESVTQYDDVSLSWVGDTGGILREWDAEVVACVPNRRVAWRAVEGSPDGGAVTFHRLGPESTRVLLRLDFDPEGVPAHLGDPDTAMSRRAETDLRRFRVFVESRSGSPG